MKTRTGFVSNSSASSFIVITTRENWKKVSKNLHPMALDVAKGLKQSKGDEFLGQEVVSFGIASGHDYHWAEDWEPSCPDDAKDSIPEEWKNNSEWTSAEYDVDAIWEDVVAELRKNGPVFEKHLSDG